jgi:DNA-binding NarL/FixJ family response regulator
MTNITRRTPQRRKAKVLIVDDHPVVREGLAQLINHQSDLTVCGEAEDVPGALDAIKRCAPELAIVDIGLKGRNGLELVHLIKSQHHRVHVLVLSMHDESLYAERVLKAGAQGYVMKEAVREQLLTAIRRVLAGEIYVSERMASRLLHEVAGGTRPSDSPPGRLSDRELEVFEWLGRGRGTREIAQLLHLSAKTIETYRAHIMQKLNLQNATELVQRAFEWVQRQHAQGLPAARRPSGIS